MAHDTLCTFAPCECYKDGSGIHSCGTDTCQCGLIAKVRADEAPKAVTRWIEQGASSDDWMKVWQVRDYAEELEVKARFEERQRIIGVMERNADGDAMKVIDAVLDMI